jgi:hypothetical protein
MILFRSTPGDCQTDVSLGPRLPESPQLSFSTFCLFATQAASQHMSSQYLTQRYWQKRLHGGGMETLLNRIIVVQSDVSRWHGVVPETTYAIWLRWLVVKVKNNNPDGIPTYYFVDQKSRKVVGPWSPGEEVHLETFEPDSRFVAFARKSFSRNSSTTRRIHHFNPATGKETKYDIPEAENWQECISADGTTMALVSGGNESHLRIEILNLSDGSTKRVIEFPGRTTLPSDRRTREGYGREWDLSADGRFLMLASRWTENENSNRIEFWDTTSGKLHHFTEEARTTGSVQGALWSIVCCPDGNDVAVAFIQAGKVVQQRVFDLAQGSFRDGFNPWEGVTWSGQKSREFNVRHVGMDGRNVLWIRHPMPEDRHDFFEWEIRVTDLKGKVLRDWRKLTDSVARRLDGRLNARLVPGSTGLVIMHPDAARLSWYDWKTDELKTLARTHKADNGVEYYATQHGRVSVLYREENSDITVKVWEVGD